MDFKIDPSVKLTPELVKKLNAAHEIKLVEKEINTIDEWIVLISDTFESARKGGSTISGLVEAYRDILSRMENRKKSCYREKAELNKRW